jgi:hypothetical protein
MTQIHDLLFNLLYNNTDTLFEVYKEYLTYNDATYIVKNDEDGLNDVFEGRDVFEIVRATCYGSYSVTESYAQINKHGNLTSTDYLEDWVDIHKIIDWMLDNKEDAGCAWDCIRYDEILAFDLHFQEMFASDFALKLDDVEKWYNDFEDAFEHIIMTPWDELKDEFDDWETNKEIPTEKEKVFDDIKQILETCEDNTFNFPQHTTIIQEYYGKKELHILFSLRLVTDYNGKPSIIQDTDVIVDREVKREYDDVMHLSLDEMRNVYNLMCENA